MYSGYDKNGEWYQLYQIGFGGIPARPIGDGLMAIHYGQAFKNVPNEFLEAYFRFALKPMSQLQTQAVLDITGVVTAFAWVTDSLRMEKFQFMMTVG